MPNCLFNEIRSAKTFDLCTENTSDHLPIMVKLNQREFPYCITNVSDDCCIASGKRPKIRWSKFSSEKIHEKYVIPLLSDLSEVDMCDLIDSKTAADKLPQMLTDNSLSLVSSVPSTRRNASKNISYVNFRMTSRLLVPCVRLLLALGRIMFFPVLVTFTTLIAAFVKSIACLCVISEDSV